MEILIIFHGNLKDLLKPALAEGGPVCHLLDRRASIKAVVESLGVPHPEIARLTVNGREVSFAYIVEDSDRIEVWPLAPPVDLLSPSILRPESLTAISFVVDVNVGKLARLLPDEASITPGSPPSSTNSSTNARSAAMSRST